MLNVTTWTNHYVQPVQCSHSHFLLLGIMESILSCAYLQAQTPNCFTLFKSNTSSKIERIGYFTTASGDALSECGLFLFPNCSPCCPLCGLWNNLWPNQHDFLGMHKNPVQFLLVYVEFALQSAILPPPRGRLFIKQEWAFHFLKPVSFKNFFLWYPSAIIRNFLKRKTRQGYYAQ